MEQESAFRIFPLQRINSSHVSAVKPQSVVENTSFFQNLKSPHKSENKSYMSSNSDCSSLKVSPKMVIDEESPESIHQVYSKLHREVEKIRKWKSNVEFEIKEKETKVAEKRDIIDAQKKVIQELRFENGNFKLQLEDMIHENEDLVKQGNSTRHLCNILKETCDSAAEKANMYENEIDDTRHFYVNLNNNIERMIMAFEELRIQAENSRQELYNQIKQDDEKQQAIQNEQTLELARCKKKILELIQNREDDENKIRNLTFQLNDSCNKIEKLTEISDNYQTELEKHKTKSDEIIIQLEAAHLAVQNTKNALKSTENELQTAQTSLSEATKEKHSIVVELEETRSEQVWKLSVLQSKLEDLEESLLIAQRRLEEKEAELEAFKQEVMTKSSDLDELRKTNEIQKTEVEQYKSELEESLKAQKELEKKIAEEKSENNILKNKELDLLLNQENLQEQLHSTVKENTNLKQSVDDLKEVQLQLQENLKSREDEIDTLNIKINASSVDTERNSKKIEDLKTEVSQREEKYLKLKEAYDNIFTEKVDMSRKIEECINLQKDYKVNRQQKEQAMTKIENLEKTNDYLRQVESEKKETESLKEQLKAKDKESSSQHEDKKKHFENEFSKKEKLQKTLENKLSTLKKQVENKNKTIEELQKENKALKKKMKEGCKQCSVLEDKVNELQIQIENASMQYEKVVSSKQLEITDAKRKEESLHQEVERLKLSSEEALRMQRESDVKCQHKIAEMMALMEKHKHQYDKLLEEKDAELGGLRAKEQEITATRVLMETELSNKNNEIVTLKKHLQQEKQQKEKMNFKSSKQHKEVQTVYMETPKQSTKMGELQHSSAFSTRTLLKEKVKMPDNKNAFLWTSSKGNKSIVPQTFYVKTPPKFENVIITNLQDSPKKKRKVALQFDFHSDSSDPTDILGICGNENMLKSLYHKTHSTPITHTLIQKKSLTEAHLKSPGSALKTSTIKKMREAGWAAISKIDRKRKMKAAEKIFN